MSEYIAYMFKNLGETPWYLWVVLGALIAVTALIALVNRRWSTRMLVIAAMCLALGFILSMVRLYRMPQGGSITLASMLPIMLFSYFFGVGPGLLVGAAYGLLQLLQDPFFLHPAQMLFDYFFPFVALAFCGALRNTSSMPQSLRLILGIALAALLRVGFHVVSGALFFAEYAGDMNPWIYSLGYNFSSVGVDGLICVAIALVPPVGAFIENTRRRLAPSAAVRAA